MKYAKPEIILAGPAIALVQGVGKYTHTNQDNYNGDTSFDCLIPAYSADE
jgi:hypothetical protein